MMAPEPLRSAMTIGRAEDTSLALPSDDKLRSGQQRVLDQVYTIKRSKSKQGKTGSLSPTGFSPQPLTTSGEFGTFKFSPSKANGTFSRNNSTMSTGYKMVNAQRSQTLSAKAMGGRNLSTSGIQQIATSTWPNRLKPSRSDPALAPPFSPAPLPATLMRNKGHALQTRGSRHSTYSMTNGMMTNSQTRTARPSSLHSQTDGKMGTMKTSAVNSSMKMPDMTLKDAVEFLSHPEEDFQLYGASYIQQTTFKEDSAKQEVFERRGIPPLVALMRSTNPEVSQTAAGALRNLVYRHQNNKLEVQQCEGIAKALQLLKETDSTETQKQITGLLWNLSSADELKGELTTTALPALTEHVVVPFTCWSDNITNNNIHPDVFFNATGCLRNLSCAKEKERKAMRSCNGLIDSLVSYVQSCVAEETPDDKSVENCVCILHNLTYKLEKENPDCFENFRTQSKNEVENKKSPTIGCFSPKSSKTQKEFRFDAVQMPAESTPAGVKWLCHPKAMQTYLSLLGSSRNDATLEACCGALQNLTASQEPGSTAMSKIMVQKLGALPHMSHLLQSPNKSLQMSAVALLGNMSRTSTLSPAMAKQILPHLTKVLTSGPREINSDESIASACNTMRSLMLADAEAGKSVITKELVTSLLDLSENGSCPKGSKAASLLLYSMWNNKSLQGFLKKIGLPKSSFVNDHTMSLHRSSQIIE
ncbi:plakophilin-1 [Mastacembelus armatus]|uniref:Plakophilin 1 n=1 Tax=Mastacembelus armatus TaxID=205130 RepID=A0A3Q3LDR9_9TELE|nr:plakophilin-1 [Mastacembelus armatus]